MRFCELKEGDRFSFRLAAATQVFRVVKKTDDAMQYSGDTGPTYIIPNGLDYKVAWNAEVIRRG